jgi:hypothetical protein
MDTAALARRMETEREFWVVVAPGKRVKFLRPLMDEARSFGLDFGIAHVCEFLRGWDGIVESDLITTGGDTPVDYDAGLATTLLRDHIGWARTSAARLSEEMGARAKLTSTAEKNSATS